MFITINCLGMPFNGNTIKESSLGGSETAAYYLAKELAVQGHKVIMYTNMKDPNKEQGIYEGVKYMWVGNRTEQAPLGEHFHFFAENTPMDVLIIQRSPIAFAFNYAAKINLWWVHDLPIVRKRDEVAQHLWNIDGVLTVSEFHKEQYAEIYGINPEIIYPIQNGIDMELFNTTTLNLPKDFNNEVTRINLLYSSRPERGLEHLVRPDGIMERLGKVDPSIHLYVCAYNNVTEEMLPYYTALGEQMNAMPNVTVLGALTKQELADVMRQCDALVYPTPGPKQPNFDEVSCITAMEAMAAGLPMITSDRGALPETCKDSGTMLVEMNEDASVNINNFVASIIDFIKLDDNAKKEVKSLQKEAAKKFTWDIATNMLLEHINSIFDKCRTSTSVQKHLMNMSDIYAMEHIKHIHPFENDAFTDHMNKELGDCYGFAFNDGFYEHYKSYYEYEKQRGVDYGPENLDGNMRFEHVNSLIDGLADGITVLDYGCAHGHYTVNLAKRHPKKNFVGIDITQSNIDTARQWAKDEGVSNVEFLHGFSDGESIIVGEEGQNKVPLEDIKSKFDFIIAAEVIEHIANPKEYVEILNNYLKDDDSVMCITTPFGPWEAIGYKQHYPWRAHLWHFERSDLHDLFGHFPNFSIKVVPNGGASVELLGSYAYTWTKPQDNTVGEIDYERKYRETKGRQTISLCMIVRNAEDTIKRCLDSAAPIADEVIIALDRTTTDRTREIIENWQADLGDYPWPIVTIVDIDSPTEIGFDAARNRSIENATGDWILWLDSDEILVHPENVVKYMRNNGFDGYAIAQHHYSAQPVGIQKTDIPCRFFRNHRGVKFYGVVHEHPEKVMNEGVGFVNLVFDVCIAHQGYTTENIRRGRFKRNIPLLAKDREQYPDRKLGKFLWMRDLAQMCKYELEVNGGRVTPEMLERAKEGIEIWEQLLADNEIRMCVDGIEFYSILVEISGQGFEFGFAADSSKFNGGVHLEQARPIIAHFASKEHVLKLFEAITTERTKEYEKRYF